MTGSPPRKLLDLPRPKVTAISLFSNVVPSVTAGSSFSGRFSTRVRRYWLAANLLHHPPFMEFHRPLMYKITLYRFITDHRQVHAMCIVKLARKVGVATCSSQSAHVLQTPLFPIDYCTHPPPHKLPSGASSLHLR